MAEGTVSAAQLESETARTAVEIGVRLGKGRKFLCNELTPFHLCLLGTFMDQTEHLVAILFSTEEVVTKDSRGDGDSLDAHWLPWAPSSSPQHSS